MPLGDSIFRGGFETVPFGGIKVGRVFSTPVSYKRDIQDIRTSPSNSLMFMLMRRGTVAVEQRQSSQKLQSGDLLIYRQDIPFSLVFGEGYLAQTFLIPEAMLQQQLAVNSSVAPIAVRSSSSGGRFALAALRQFFDLSRLDDVALSEGIVRHTLSLLESGISADTSPLPDSRGRICDGIKNSMLRQIDNPDLDTAEICRSNGVSPRTLNRLFAAEGVTPMNWLWMQRLDRSRKALENGGETSITTVALENGFRSVSHFSIAFKRRFGLSPVEARKAAHR